MSNVSIQNTVNTWGKRPYLFIKGEQFKKKFSTFFFSFFCTFGLSKVGLFHWCGLCWLLWSVLRKRGLQDEWWGLLSLCCSCSDTILLRVWVNHQCKCSQYDIVYCPTL